MMLTSKNTYKLYFQPVVARKSKKTRRHDVDKNCSNIMQKKLGRYSNRIESYKLFSQWGGGIYDEDLSFK